VGKGEGEACSPVVVANLNPAIDRVLHASSWRLGETIRVERAVCYAGGKGANVTRALKRVGVPVKILNFLSGRTGRLWADLLADEGMEGEHVDVPGGETRINVTICHQDRDAKETHFIDTGPVISEDAWRAMQRAIEESLQQARCLVLTGSLPPGLPVHAYRDLLELAGKVPVCLDTSGAPLQSAVQKGPWLVKPNRKEAEGLLGRSLQAKEDLQWAVHCLWDLGVDVAAISLGDEGAVLGWREEIWWGKIPVDHVVSTVGCGDAFLAGLIYAATSASTSALLIQALTFGALSAMQEAPGAIAAQDASEDRGIGSPLVERWE